MNKFRTYHIRFHVELHKVVAFAVQARTTEEAICEAWQFTDGPHGYSATMETMQREIGIDRPCRFLYGCHIQVNRRWFKLTASEGWKPSNRSICEAEYRGTTWNDRWHRELNAARAAEWRLQLIAGGMAP